MRGPLAVTIIDGETRRHVTRHVAGLQFTKTAPGGYAFANMRLRLPRGTFPDLGPADRVIVSDARTGRTVFEGFAENPGVVDGPGGQEYELSVAGSTVLASDNSRALVFVDRDPSSLIEHKWTFSAPSGSSQTGDDPTGAGNSTAAPGLLLQLNPGQPVGQGKGVDGHYVGLQNIGMTFGVVRGTHKAGKTDAGYIADLTAWGGYGNVSTSLVSGVQQISQTPASFSVRSGSATLPTGTTRIALRLHRTGGATNVADDDTWLLYYDVTVIAQLVGVDGQPRNMVNMEANNGVRASDVVDDLVGRVMTFADRKVSGAVNISAAIIDQLAYPDGATPQQVLDDLALWEPDWLWEILEHTGNGWRVTYRQWPTTARYEISAARDGFSAPGGDVDLCNRISVHWTDAKGTKQTTVVTSVVPSLDDVGRTRDAEPIELEDGRGSAANAQRIGQQILAAKNTAPKAGTATVARWILDRDTGRMVGPWEIEPGHLVRVRETGDDLRLTEMEYDDQDCSATLTLGEPVLTEDQRIARLSTAKRVV